MSFLSKLWTWLVSLFKKEPLLAEEPINNLVLPPLEQIEVSVSLPKSVESVVFNEQLTKNFHVKEFACNDGTAVPEELLSNVVKLAQNLQVLRDELGKPIKVNSGYRTPKYNKSVGGAKNSQHLYAAAADIKVSGIGPAKLAEKIEALISSGKMEKGGVGVYPTFTHYDVRGKNVRWNGTRKKN